MKKHHLNISTISVLCVLCAGLTTNAMAAASVRALGGSGTFDGTSAASTSTRAVAPARAGSLRVSPAGTRLVTTTNSGKASSGATAGTTQRLSIGKYLRDNEATSGGTSGGTSAGSDPAASSARVGELEERIEALENDMGDPNAQTPASNTLAGRVAAIEDQIDLIEVGGVQGSQDGVVEVSGTGEVSINVDKLVEKLEDQGAISSSRETEIRYTSGNDLQWRYTSGSAQDQEWKTLLNASALTGDYATSDQLSQAVTNAANTYATKNELSGYATTSAMDTALAGKQATISDLETIRSGAAAGATALQPSALSGYATTEAMNAAIQQAQLDGQVDLSGYATTSAMDTALAGKQATISDLETIRSGAAAGATALQPSALSGYATTEALTTGLAGKQATISNLSAIEAGAALGATALQPGDLDDYATTASLGNYATTEALTTGLAGKQATISDLETIRSGAAAGATALQPSALSGYATTEAMNAAIQQAQLDGSDVDLSGYATTEALTSGLAGKQATISDLSDIRSGAALGATALQEADLAGYATTASLSDYATTSAMNTALAGKQATIEDLSDIRSGAALGATALQEADLAGYATTASLSDYATTSAMNTALAGKQATIEDLSDIRSGAALGATALQEADLAGYATTASLSDYATTSAMNTALAGKQATIEDLSDIRSGAAAGATALQQSDLEGYATTSAMQAAIAAAQLDGSDVDLSGYATTEALTSGLAGKQATISDLSDIRSGAALGATALQEADLAGYATTASLSDYATTSAMNTALAGKQATIEDLSDIRSGAALGATALQEADLAGYATTASLSDYATTSAMNTALAGKQATIEDLSDIRSGAALGATALQEADLAGYATTASLADYATTSAMNTALAGKQATISNLSAIEAGAALGATALQPGALDNYATTASLSDYATTSAMNTALADKQATISDLETIRSGASAGATAVQPAALNDYATIIALNAKQDAIANLATIEAGAAAGATALQPSEVTTGGANGTIAVDGTDVPVKGLGNVAYANATLPSTNGDYMLMVNRNNGTYSYTWQDASNYTGGGNSGGGNDDPVLDDEGLW